MAAEGDTQGEMQAHMRSYSRFTEMMKWGAAVSVVLALIVILLISS